MLAQIYRGQPQGSTKNEQHNNHRLLSVSCKTSGDGAGIVNCFYWHQINLGLVIVHNTKQTTCKQRDTEIKVGNKIIMIDRTRATMAAAEQGYRTYDSKTGNKLGSCTVQEFNNRIYHADSLFDDLLSVAEFIKESITTV